MYNELAHEIIVRLINKQDISELLILYAKEQARVEDFLNGVFDV